MSPLAKAGHVVGAFLLVPTALAMLRHPVQIRGDLPDDGLPSALYVASLSSLNNMGASVSGAWPGGWDESATRADPASLNAFVFRPAPAVLPEEARFTEVRTERPWEAPLSRRSGRAGPALRQIRQALAKI
jgi:hypothetical protein